MNEHLRDGKLVYGIATRLTLGDGDVVILAANMEQLCLAAAKIHPDLTLKPELTVKAFLVHENVLDGGAK